MTNTFYEQLPDLTIASGQQNSNWLIADEDYSDANCLTIATPTGAAETFKFQTSFDDGVTVVDIESSDGSGLESLPAAGQARQYFNLTGFPMLRIRSTIATAAERVFTGGKQWMV